MDAVFLGVLADLCVNIAAACFVAVFIPKPKKVKLLVLTLNIVLGSIFLLIAYSFRKAM